MTETITLPVWIFSILLTAFVLVVIRVVIYPLWASFWSVRSRHVVEEINPLLQLGLSSFTLTRRQVLADRLASDERIEAGVAEIARQRGEPLESVRREAWRISWDIVPAFNPYFYFRVGYRMARNAVRALYRIRIAFADEAAMAEAGPDASVLFIINHRSNIDYVITNYLTAKRTMLSFGVGEWSRLWPIQPLMRMAGGYFVRRDSGDPLYRMLLKRYVQMATQARVPHAIFIEGQLSPDGAVGEARAGLLSYVTEDFHPETSPDLVFIPIAINYDHIAEDVNMVRFTSAEFREKGRRYVALKGLQFGLRVAWEVLLRRRSYGCTCANFGLPISFSAWLRQRDVDWPAQTREQRFHWIQELGGQLIGDITALVPATPVPMLCRLWFDNPSQVIAESTLADRFSAMVACLRDAGCHPVLVGDAEQPTLEHALGMALKRGMIVRDGRGGLAVNPSATALVRYYGNSLSQYFE
jgi:glycerol-3-phosphate O-acyltransferase